jgi:ubiquitin C-terminal hydrolase
MNGLVNLGNTCYLNSVIQILNQLPELNDKIAIETLDDQCTDSVLTREWMLLYGLIKMNKGRVIAPKRFVDQVRRLAIIKKRTEFAGFQQNDASDYLSFVLDCIHTSLKKKNTDDACQQCDEVASYLRATEQSPVAEVFTCAFVYEYFNIETHVRELKKIEHGLTLELSLPPSIPQTTILECMLHTFKEEPMVDDNAWYDDVQQTKKNVLKKTCLGHAPPILCVHLKRWTHTLHKDNRLVQSPHVLHLDPPITTVRTDYELIGVINHVGSVGGGHYFSFVKHGPSWYEMNDERVAWIHKDKVIQPCNYCLFYRKR